MQTNNSSYFSRNLPFFILFMNKYNSAYFFKQDTTLILFTTYNSSSISRIIQLPTFFTKYTQFSYLSRKIQVFISHAFQVKYNSSYFARNTEYLFSYFPCQLKFFITFQAKQATPSSFQAKYNSAYCSRNNTILHIFYVEHNSSYFSRSLHVKFKYD